MNPMTRVPFRTLAALSILAALSLAAPLRAQQPEEPAPWRPLRIAKWSAVSASAAAALYGFVHNRRADDAYADIETVCALTPDRCAKRTDGAYADAGLEAEYQHIRSLDRRARTALIASQVGIAASVILFILDLRNQRPPDNIPYEPRRLEIGPADDGGVSVRIRLPAGHRR